jgi:hypothetical protein
MSRVLWTILWEQPQTILGAALLVVRWSLRLVGRIEIANGRVFVLTRGGAVSLGVFVFYNGKENRYFYPGSGIREHEYGHTFQSRWLGPLYLLVVGIPSVARGFYAVLYRELTGRRWRGYFDGWPENQADRLGGVDRNKIKSNWPAR